MNYYPDDIAAVLCKLAEMEDPDTVHYCENALYNIKVVANNEFNADYWRTFWQILEKIAEKEENR